MPTTPFVAYLTGLDLNRQQLEVKYCALKFAFATQFTLNSFADAPQR